MIPRTYENGEPRLVEVTTAWSKWRGTVDEAIKKGLPSNPAYTFRLDAHPDRELSFTGDALDGPAFLKWYEEAPRA